MSAPMIDVIRRLEEGLGDPSHPDSPMSFRYTMAMDEAEQVPAASFAALDSLGVRRYFVPAAYGGALESFQQLLGVVRVIARRDLTVAAGYGSTLSAVGPVWMWGTDAQRELVAKQVLAPGGFGVFGVSEERLGSDLIRSEFEATPSNGGWSLSGEKWTVGNPGRASFITLLARTDREGGPRGLSFFLVPIAELAPGSYRPIKPIKCLGLRGHDFGGFTLEDGKVPDSAILGGPAGLGLGIERVLTMLQLGRTMISGISLGMADSAFRIALYWSRRRQLYGKPIGELPIIREGLLACYLDLLIAECVTLACVRGIDFLGSRMSLWSSVAKYYVTTLGERIVAEASRILSARAFLRENVAEGMFQKIKRDQAILSVFEGTTHVNLQIAAVQLPQVARKLGRPNPDLEENLRRLFDLSVELPAWRPDRAGLELSNHGHDEITDGWDRARAAVTELAGRSGAGGTLAEIAARVDRLDAARKGFLAELAALPKQERRPHESVSGFLLAERHAVFHAASVCLHTWLYNRSAAAGPLADGEWLALCLERLLQDLEGRRPFTPHLADKVASQMLACLEENRLFSLFPVPLGRAPK